MKTCPQCNRTYADNTLSFCLEDGSPLSGSDLPRTVAASSLDADSARTAILPPDRRPTNDPPQPTIAAVTSEGYRHATIPNERKSRSGLWIILGGTFALAFVGLIVVVGYMAWKASDNGLVAASSAPGSNAPVNTNVQTNDDAQTNSNLKSNITVQPNNNVPANTNVQNNSNVAGNANEATSNQVDDNLNWLEGVWAGEGYQSDTKTTWTVILTVRDGSFGIEYPNIPCGGTWNLTNKNSKGASFIEYITHGTDRCVQNERVMLEKTSDSEISLKFSHAGNRSVIATAVLTRKATN